MSTARRDHFVYEAYDADGLLLYVGCTGNLEKRLSDHLRGNGDARGWFDAFVVQWRASGPYTKEVAQTVHIEGVGSRGNGNKSVPLRRWRA